METHCFMVPFLRDQFVATLGGTRRLHKSMVNMLPNPAARYIVLTRAETPHELVQRGKDDAELLAYDEYTLRGDRRWLAVPK